jgi:putative ABC transport system permease protein
MDLGMEPDRVLAVELHHPRSPPVAGETVTDRFVRTGALERTRYETARAAALRVPGVERAAVSVGIPFYSGFSVPLWVPGLDSIPPLPGGGPYVTAVGADYFVTMGTAIRRGRAFDATDRAGSEAVVIVNETMANALWPGQNPLTRCVVVGARTAPCARVVGVAADLHRSGLREDPSMQHYVPIGQERGFSGSWLLVRPTGAVSAEWPALRRALLDADPSIQSVDVRVLAQGLDNDMRPIRLGITAFGLSALVALMVAGLGLYSIMAHSVAWRRREIGIRMALGARSRSIALFIVGQGALLRRAVAVSPTEALRSE